MNNKKYLETCYAYHRFFWQYGIDCDIVSPKADLSDYKLVIAPMLYLTDADTVSNLEGYVSGGGHLYATYMLGTVDGTDLCYLGGIPGGRLKDVFGIISEEIDTLYPEERQHVAFNGEEHEVVDYCEVIRLTGARLLASYSDAWYQTSAAVTANAYGKGKAYYQACRDSGSLKDAVLEQVISDAGIQSNMELLRGCATAHSRTDGVHTYLFVENYTPAKTAEIKLHEPMLNMLTGQTMDKIVLEPYSFEVLKSL